MRLTFIIANNICTLLMPVYKYGIAMFYIYLYLYMSISIYTAILCKERERKIMFSQEIGLIGALQSWARKKGSMTTLALDNHTWDGWFSDHIGGRKGLALGERLRVPQSATATLHLLLQNHSLCAGPHLSMELLKESRCLGTRSWGSLCHCFSWTVRLSFRPRIWLASPPPSIRAEMWPHL